MLRDCEVLMCLPGCLCEDGYLFDESTYECTAPENCPCMYGGKTYTNGQSTTVECNQWYLYIARSVISLVYYYMWRHIAPIRHSAICATQLSGTYSTMSDRGSHVGTYMIGANK